MKLAPLLLLAACSATPPPPPSDADLGALAVTVRLQYPRESARRRPQIVYFIRLEDDVDPAYVRDLIPSNFTKGGVCYLLNATPGRYAAVACRDKKDGRNLTTYFSGELIQDTATSVEAGRVAYMGTIDTELKPITAGGDKVQNHFHLLMNPDWHHRPVAVRLFARSYYFNDKRRNFRRNDTKTEARAREYLATAGWH